MSQILIQKYLNQLANLRKVSGTTRESVVREAFKDLLKQWGKDLDLTFIPEYAIETKTKERRYIDGALLHTLRVPFGYWEAKDEEDDLDAEIERKFRRGYPRTNIIFDDSVQAVLFQHGREVMRCTVEDVLKLENLLSTFFSYERPEIEAFRRAVDQFKKDLPAVLNALRSMIERAHARERNFKRAAQVFLAHAQEAINPSLGDADVREMLIQHILTGEIFRAVFPGNPFHEDNNVAIELHKLEATFFVGDTKFQTLRGLEPYYTAIRKAAAEISTHHEKQAFLKSIYENFYKVYNPKAADRLGVVYTPNEVVRFIIESADVLCQRHFRRNLIDRDVDILDPATGTGTFICELIEHFSGQREKLLRKYRSELHANEVAILPYYVANLNIEATFAAATGEYVEYPGLCFVDTLDNTHALRKYKGHMDDLFGSVTDDNIKRIRQQNAKTISVVIGNPPYNANQLNENENNKNREYPEIDKRIKETYIASSDAQKTKLYDMYVRFFRWAADRLDQNAILAFVSNRSFIDSRTFDGFRCEMIKEFNEIHILDLGGDVRANPKLSGTKHNVFGIQTGVSISLMVRKAKQKGCRIYYSRRPEMETAGEKLSFLASTRLDEVEFTELRPDEKHNWLTLEDSDFDSLMPVASKDSKRATKSSRERTIFKLYSLGISTNRDEWLYADTKEELRAKVKFLIQRYSVQPRGADFDTSMKWSRNLKRRFTQGRTEKFEERSIVRAAYRPYYSPWLYDSSLFIDEGGSKDEIFPTGEDNVAICFSDVGSRTEYVVLGVRGLADLHFGSSVDAYQQLPKYRFQDGQRSWNITNWALDRFRKHYKAKRRTRGEINEEAIFNYVYGVLHDPVYRERYAPNLKREFPRVPFYPDFWKWSDWGAELLNLHTNYQSAPMYPLGRLDNAPRSSEKPRCILKEDRDESCIVVDSHTTLTAVPSEAWKYRLGTRSALGWVLEQYREAKPRDPTIRDKFNTYRFAVHKEDVIQLLMRVVTVSVETVKIAEAMRAESR